MKEATPCGLVDGGVFEGREVRVKPVSQEEALGGVSCVKKVFLSNKAGAISGVCKTCCMKVEIGEIFTPSEYPLPRTRS